MKNLKTALPFLFIALTPLSFAASFKGEAYEQGSNKTKLLYKITRTETLQGNQTLIRGVSATPDGAEAVIEEATLIDSKLSAFKITQKQLNEAGELTVKDGRLFFKYTKNGKTDTDDEKATDDLIIGPTTVDYLTKHWDTLLKGDDLSARFASLDRKETVGFKFFKIGEVEFKNPKTGAGEPAVQIKMKPSSIIIAALVKPLIFTMSKDGKRLLELNGRIPPKQNVDGKWKDLDAEVLYTY